MQVSEARKLICDDIRIAVQNVEFQSGLALKAGAQGQKTACVMHAQSAEMYYSDMVAAANLYLQTFTLRGQNAEHDD
jgi:hypothetical protein